jgi:hypothetical protein
VKVSASNQKTMSSDCSLGRHSSPSPLSKHFDLFHLEIHHPSKDVSSILEGYSNFLDAVVEVSKSDSREGQPRANSLQGAHVLYSFNFSLIKNTSSHCSSEPSCSPAELNSYQFLRNAALLASRDRSFASSSSLRSCYRATIPA